MVNNITNAQSVSTSMTAAIKNENNVAAPQKTQNSQLQTNTTKKNTAEILMPLFNSMGNLGMHAVNNVLSIVTPLQWQKGVVLKFEKDCDMVFFKTFASFLHGKAGGLEVKYNEEKRRVTAKLKLKDPSETILETGKLKIKINNDATTRLLLPEAKSKKQASNLSTTAIHWRKEPISFEKSYEKMMKNSLKAIVEHRKKEGDVYITVEELGAQLAELESKQKMEQPLKISYEDDEEKGPRPTMDDIHFCIEKHTSLLAAVFDGHGGEQVAEFARDYFKVNFYKILNACGNVHQTFEEVFYKMQQEISKRSWGEIGSTAVVCFVDKINNLVYTATLADSEANIYREIGGQMKSIPLSCVRDWSCPKEALRASKSLLDPKIAYEWPGRNPKILRFHGLNVSRALGDVSRSGAINRPGIIQKPKITVNKLKRGDVLILACDGLKDFVKEGTIANEIADNKSKKEVNLASHLVKVAVKDNFGQDNCTVVALKFN